MDFLTHYVEQFKSKIDGPQSATKLKTIEDFLEFINADMAADPVIGINFASGQMIRRSGRVFGSIPMVQPTQQQQFIPPMMHAANPQAAPTSWPFAQPVNQVKP